jgi:branched-chain amino acid transport system permease protein
MNILIEQILNGLILGSQYALVATGLAIIFGVVGIVNFAHGEFFMVGAYIFYMFYRNDTLGAYFLAVAAAIVVMYLLGRVYERIVINRIIDRSWHSQLVATLATSIILINLAILIFGTTPKVTPTVLSKTIVSLGFINISYQRICIFLVTGLVFILLNLFLQRTKLGKAMRAISQNRDASEIYGVDIRKVSEVTIGIGAGLAALAAGFMSPLFNILPTMGLLLVLKAFAAVIMGGFGNVKGAIYAAYLIGIIEALAIGYSHHLNIESAYKDVFVYGIMILVLLLRPQGLFGKKVGI